MRSTFVSEGFSNWKKARERLQKHNESDAHKDSFMHVENLPKTVSDISEMLSKGLAAEKLENSKCLMKIIENVKYHAETNIPFQGENLEASNFYKTAKLRALDDEKFSVWIEKKREHFLHHEIQNEILKIMALQVLRKIVKDIQSCNFWALMSDETTDISVKVSLNLLPLFKNYANSKSLMLPLSPISFFLKVHLVTTFPLKQIEFSLRLPF